VPPFSEVLSLKSGAGGEVDLLVLLDEEVPAPRYFDGVGGEGHGACGEQGGEHQSDALCELEQAL